MNEKEKEAYSFYKKCNVKDLENFDYFSEPSKLQIKYMETVLNLIEKQQAEIESLEQEKQEAWEEWNNIDNYCEQEKQKYKAEIEKKDKIIHLMAEYMEEEFAEYQLDNIYAELNNCNGMERNWTRGKEAEIKDIKKYFSQKIEKGE